jgi:Peptidase family M28
LLACTTALSFIVYSQSAKSSQSFDSHTTQTAPASLDREVRADMAFLADDDLRGRGSATRDEHIAALFAASQFQSFGLEPGAPGNSFIQKSALPDELPESAKRRISRLEDTPRKETWNAIAILRGSDSRLKDEVILLTAHLDHLGVAAQPINGDSIFNGADDDASGTTAILTLAHVFATGPRPKRTIIFALFGSEELGGFGARAFLANPPIPLHNIVANLEFEMIGRRDPAVPADTLWLTGYERSNLGPELARHHARLVPDPHPKENFFQRSDNIGLARQGIIAQTVSSYGLHSDYHQPTDELSAIDFPHMVNAIASIISPIRWLADTNWKPQWNPGGQPSPAAASPEPTSAPESPNN